MKRKPFSIMLCLFLMFSFTACGNGDSKEEKAPQSETEQTKQMTSYEDKQDTTSVTTEIPEMSEISDSASGKDALVVVFSVTGTTKGVAEKIVSITDADFYEIIPSEPYSSKDLNYNDSGSRATREQNDDSVRPEIGSEDINPESYSTIFIGFPIWWDQEPRIMDTFVEKYNFEGITMIPFCTSGSSGIGQSGKYLEENAGSGIWLEGRRFDGSVSEDELMEWITDLGLSEADNNTEEESDVMNMKIGDTPVNVTWEDNSSVEELKELSKEGLTIFMSMYGGFEQVGSIGQSITRSDRQTTTSAGDIVLYSGNRLVVFYGSNSWAYTRLGKIDLSEEELTNLLGNGDVIITLKAE